MTWPTVCHMLRTKILVASICLVAISQPSTSSGNLLLAASNISFTTAPVSPRHSGPVSQYKPSISEFFRNMSYLFAPTSWRVVGAMGLAIYFDNRRPYPTTCNPPAIDKWQHCYVGCMIANWIPSGSISASVLAVMKEVRDKFDYGDFSWPDVYATLKGAWHCDGCESCEACCCEILIQDELEKRRRIP